MYCLLAGAVYLPVETKLSKLTYTQRRVNKVPSVLHLISDTEIVRVVTAAIVV